MFMRVKVSFDLFGVLNLISSVGRFRHRVRLQKYVLLAQREVAYPFSFNFERYFYGPYSFDLRNFMDVLVSEGLVKEEKTATSCGVEYSYELTGIGELFLGDISKQVPDNEKQKLRKLVRTLSDLSDVAVVKRAKQVFGW